MLAAYTRYCAQGTPASLREFLEEAFHFNFVDYKAVLAEMFKVYQSMPLMFEETRSLSSNGTVGKRATYTFGPHTNYTTYTTECYLRNMKNLSIPRIILYDTFPFYMPAERLWVDKKLGVDYHVRCDLNSHRAEDFLLAFLRQLDDKQYNIYNTLGKWQRLVNLPRIVEFINQHENFLITNADSEAFFKRSTFNQVLNDQMIDWKSGVNFYTCPNETLHFIPLFYSKDGKTYNLLNLADKQGWDDSDIFDVSEQIEVCACGKHYLPFKFIPHFQHSPTINGEYIYDIGLAEKLKSCYNNIHFIQRDDEIDVSYSLMRGEMLDEERLTSHFSCKLNFLPNTIFRVGRGKQVVFWKGKQSLWPTINPFL